MGKRKERAYGDGRVFRPKGSKKWMAAWCVNGKEVRRSTGTESEAAAHDFLRKMLGDKVDGRPAPLSDPCTFEDMAALLENDYRVNGHRSLKRALQSVEHLRRTFGADRATAITTDRIVAYQAARLAEKAARATVRLELSALKRMFHLARRHGRLHQVPDFKCPTVNNARQGFFEEAALRRVLEHLPEHLRPPVRFAYLTGWRRGEVVGLRWAQVDLQEGTVRLEPGTTKNDEGRMFPVASGSELEALLREQRDGTTALERATSQIVPWVFHRRGEPLRDFYGAWRTACLDAGVPGRLFHDLRRTAVRNLERAGVPRSWAMRLTGHKTESVFRRYAIVAEQDLRDGVARLTAWQAEQGKRRTEAQR